MNTRLIRTTLVLLIAPALCVAGCAAAKTTEAISSPQEAQFERQYADTIDRLMPGMSAEKIVDRKDAQLEFEGICFAASAPGKEVECAALCRAIVAKIGPEAARPARVWLLRKIEPIGRDESVAGLAKLLHDQDPEIRDLARRALQNNPSPNAGDALRAALANARSDEWRIALINALGARRDVASVRALNTIPMDRDTPVARAAVAALGDIATNPAVRTLSRLMTRAKPPLRDTVVDALLRAAEALAARGSRNEAARLYEQLDAPAQPERIRIAAIEGLARVQGVKALPRLIELVGGNAVRMQLIAAQCMCDIQEPTATTVLADALNGASPSAAVILLDVLSQRGHAAAMPAVIKKVNDPDPAVRIAACNALKRIGDSSVVALLVERAAKSDGDERAAAADALVHLRGRDVDKEIAAAIDAAEPPLRSILVQAAADRRSAPLLPALYANVDDPDEAARVAVVKALGRLAPTGDLPTVVNALVNVRGDAMRTSAEEAVCLVAERIQDPSKRVAPVIAAMSDAPPQTQVSLIHILGRLQGDAALAALRRSYASEDKAVRDAAAEAMSKWPAQSCATWLFAGPYKADDKKAADLFDMTFEPEDPDAKTAWKPLDVESNRQSGETPLHKIYKEQDCCAYVKTKIWSEKEQEAQLILGSDDGIKVWLDGKVVHAKNASRSLKCAEDTATVTLKKGWNPLLIKITQGGGDWSFCCGVKAPQGGPIEGLKFDPRGGE